MNILKDPLTWAVVAVTGAYGTFGPLVLTMAGVLDNDVARSITLYVGALVFIPSLIAMKITSRFAAATV